ncbi:DMT family transporter [Mangrovibacterium lignilyticum]|uniref:DMT family transporter n=1 Tax=Mangrovibacterium lignilyticum TaxID=2668052 RepID=UPI0013D564C9|nr:DMT family transporter [Mangrovibacterium lignilyticum]
MNQKSLFSNTIFLAIVACLLWSSAFVGVKIGLNYHTPFQFAGVRFTISGLMLFLYFNNRREYLDQLCRHWRFIGQMGLLQTVVIYMLFYSGINLLPAAISAMIIGSSPLFISTVSHFYSHNDKMDGLKSVSLLLGVVGVAIISLSGSDISSGPQLSVFGVLLLLTNNLISGFTNVLAARKPANLSPIVLSSSSLFFGGLALVAISIPIEGYGLKAVSTAYFVSLAWLSFLSAAAFAIWFTLLSRPGVKVSELNTWKFLVPVSGAILSWLIIPEETPEIASIAGMVVIASSLLVMNYSNRRNSVSVRKKIQTNAI